MYTTAIFSCSGVVDTQRFDKLKQCTVVSIISILKYFIFLYDEAHPTNQMKPNKIEEKRNK